MDVAIINGRHDEMVHSYNVSHTNWSINLTLEGAPAKEHYEITIRVIKKDCDHALDNMLGGAPETHGCPPYPLFSTHGKLWIMLHYKNL